MSGRPTGSQASLFDDLFEPATSQPGSKVPVSVAPDRCEPKPYLVEELAFRECGALPPILLARLPLATTLTLRTREARELWVTTGQATYAELRDARAIVLTGRELGALAVAAENGRASALWLAAWFEARALQGGIPLDVPTALDGCQDAQTPNQRWPLSRVLKAWSLTLTGLAVGDGDAREVLA